MSTDTPPSSTGASPAGPAPMLTELEARILGSLIEKAATTPDAYPLTLNNIQLACNQKTSREPVMQLEVGEIGHALRVLEPRGLVKSEYGARAERYLHRLDRVLDLTPGQTALLALLMLRGAQTIGELLTRSERLHRFADVNDVRHTLERMAERDTPLVRMIGRAAGQREDRYAHLLCGEPVLPEPGPSSARSTQAHAVDADTVHALLERIDALEARVAALEASRTD